MFLMLLVFFIFDVKSGFINFAISFAPNVVKKVLQLGLDNFFTNFEDTFDKTNYSLAIKRKQKEKLREFASIVKEAVDNAKIENKADLILTILQELDNKRTYKALAEQMALVFTKEFQANSTLDPAMLETLNQIATNYGEEFFKSKFKWFLNSLKKSEGLVIESKSSESQKTLIYASFFLQELHLLNETFEQDLENIRKNTNIDQGKLTAFLAEFQSIIQNKDKMALNLLVNNNFFSEQILLEKSILEFVGVVKGNSFYSNTIKGIRVGHTDLLGFLDLLKVCTGFSLNLTKNLEQILQAKNGEQQNLTQLFLNTFRGLLEKPEMHLEKMFIENFLGDLFNKPEGKSLLQSYKEVGDDFVFKNFFDLGTNYMPFVEMLEQMHPKIELKNKLLDERIINLTQYGKKEFEVMDLTKQISFINPDVSNVKQLKISKKNVLEILFGGVVTYFSLKNLVKIFYTEPYAAFSNIFSNRNKASLNSKKISSNNKKSSLRRKKAAKIKKK